MVIARNKNSIRPFLERCLFLASFHQPSLILIVFFGVPYLVIFLVQKNELATLTTEEQANLVVNAKVVNPDGTS